MSARIVPFDYQGQAVTFNADGWINGTVAATQFRKEPHEWLRLPDTERYLEGLKRRYGEIPYVKTSRARADRGGGTWFHPKLAVKFARWLSVDFEIWCDEQIDSLVRGDANAWKQARQQSAVGYRGLCDALALSYEEMGKKPKPHHYMNEARLINEVITGQFSGRNRDQLTEAELVLVTLVEVRDVLLMGQGKDFSTRKTLLVRYVQSLQTKQLKGRAA